MYQSIEEKKQYNISIFSFDVTDMEALYQFFIQGRYESQIERGFSKEQAIAISIHDILIGSEKHTSKREEMYESYQRKYNLDYKKILQLLCSESIQKQKECKDLLSDSEIKNKQAKKNSPVHKKYQEFLVARKLYDNECIKSVLECLGNSTIDAETAIKEFEHQEKSNNKVNSMLNKSFQK